MKRCVCLCATLTVAVATLVDAQEMPEIPKPQKEHEFLHKFVGEWDAAGKGTAAEGQPTPECNGTFKSRMLGGFWLVSEGKGDAMGMPMENVMTLGYDPEKQRYVGTWVDSVFNHMWKYEGTLEGSKLTLGADGPDMTDPGKMAKYRDVFEFKSADHYTLTSMVQGPDGTWTTFMTSEVTRKK